MDRGRAHLVHTEQAAPKESKASTGPDRASGPGEISSAEERHVHTVDVSGSIPLSPTTPDDYLPRSRGVKPGQRPPAFIYFVRAEALRLVKIGATVEPMSRMTTLRCASPDRLTLVGVIRTSNGYQQEGSLHRRFAHLRSHGEWFRLAPDLEAFMAAEVENYDDMLSRENRDLANQILSRHRLERTVHHEP